MLRTALRPWSLLLLAVALAAATAFAALGDWQLARSRSQGPPSTAEQVLPLAQVLAPATTFPGTAVGQRVSARGQFLPEEQLLVAGRALDGEEGSWVLAPLQVQAAGGTALLPVVRGWVAAGQEASVPAPPDGEVEVVGRLQPGEPPAGVAPGADGAPALSAVSSADLVNVWQPPLHTGYVVQEEAPAPLAAVPSAAPEPEVDLRNVSYALQWWLFAAFAVFLWWRAVRERHRGEQEERAEEDGAVGGTWEDGPVRHEQVDQQVVEQTQEAGR
ncbi:SURF1 family protein [Quadrisphaera sp. DSM 44207]|uniref:SURF1 family protein n=1 Tax=Quadrisphaera sp. DSM 44207 TaxID=1881057 RepID=UPI00088467D8|nr:SURF1 family protein [Quadrisphaera sp. DSM 44207]SDQ13152.1 Cytochrome oxidase assembly protein ShyY1 [Quadrisphaera sp. DSM 44207]